MALTREGRAIWAWSFYDFANSSFTTLVVTFIYAAYFADALAPDDFTGTALWSKGVAISGIAVALLSPPLGALADACSCRRLFLLISTALCVLCTVGLFFPVPGEVYQALAWFMVANISFELGSVFYNSFLPEIASADRIGRVSGYGWSFGYVGGLLCMGIAMVGFVNSETPWFGFGTEQGEHYRATNLLVAVWFTVFSLPALLWLRESKCDAQQLSWAIASRSLTRLWATVRKVRGYPQIVRLLIARLFYNDGMVTVFAFGGIYAVTTFQFSFEQLMYFGLTLNVSAGVGAFLFGFVDDRVGARPTIFISLTGLIAASLTAAITENSTVFWVTGIIIGLLSGPAQSASRSMMARFIPNHMESEFFGFYAFSGKATAFIGPLLLGELTLGFGSQRAGISVVVVLLLLGALLLTRVDTAEGQRAAGRG
ncbi:MAG: MFS transporter [Candidatus Latescibacterota bacterium]|nr:MFS transporter [Candidatus Latescibacterota bacterium]